MRNPPFFITLEGIEGSGKTTQIRTVENWLTTSGQTVVTTREPGGTAIGRQIRAILLNPENTRLAPMAELLLYGADRVQHLETFIRPALAAGKTVISDRFFDATVAYQGYARGLDADTIQKLHRLSCGTVYPDLTLLLDLPPEIGLKRAWRRIHADSTQVEESRFEKEALSFHQRVRDGYLDLARRDPQRFFIINADADEDAVSGQIEAALKKRLGNSELEDRK